jgi:ubiquinone/menaquinone biosynthesis C-methylase UbiE
VKPPDDVTAWNERWAREYDIDRYYAASHWLVRWIERRRVRWIERLLDATARQPPVIELGCGAGHVLSGFAAPRIGIEIAPTMLAKARTRLGPAALCVRADVEELPLRSAGVRRMICTEVIEHVVNPDRLLVEIARVLAPRGRAVITFPNEPLIELAKGWLLRLGLFRRLAPGPTASAEADWHLHSFSRALFLRLLPSSLALVATRGVPYPVLPLRYVCLVERRAE